MADVDCTCGSGTHPRRCNKHPEAFQHHVDWLDCDVAEACICATVRLADFKGLRSACPVHGPKLWGIIRSKNPRGVHLLTQQVLSWIEEHMPAVPFAYEDLLTHPEAPQNVRDYAQSALEELKTESSVLWEKMTMCSADGYSKTPSF